MVTRRHAVTRAGLEMPGTPAKPITRRLTQARLNQLDLAVLGQDR